MRIPITSAAIVAPLPGDPSPMMLITDGDGRRQAVSATLAGIEYPDDGTMPRRVYRAVVLSDDGSEGQQILVFLPVEIASEDHWADTPRDVKRREHADAE